MVALCSPALTETLRIVDIGIMHPGGVERTAILDSEDIVDNESMESDSRRRLVACTSTKDFSKPIRGL